MRSTIYLVEDEELVEIEEEEYDSEDLLQENLAEYPRLLAGDQIDPEGPRRWLLVEREISVPDEEGGSGRWSADHLFLDQDGVPTFVEVKRSRDTRVRREVVGQMLDYASNASVYWGRGRMRARFETRCESENREPEEVIRESFGEELDIEDFWENGESNLRSGEIRLLFVADEIPSELKRIIEFLNEQMDPAEVLGLEVKQYAGEDQNALVPRIIGQTEEARGRKRNSSRRNQHDRESFLEDLEEKVSEEKITEKEAEAIRDLHSFGRDKADDYGYGTGVRASFFSYWEDVHPTRKTFGILTKGEVYLTPRYPLRSDEVDWSEDKLKVLEEGLNEIEGFETSVDRLKEKRCSLDAGLLTSEESREKFKEAVLDFVKMCEEA